MNRFLIGVLVAVACGFGLWQTARFGAGRTLAERGAFRNDLAAADRAVSWLPGDASTHTARGLVLQRTGDYAEAARALERAVQLRPRDYFPWMLLGVTRDLNGDQSGAVSALRQSTACASGYAKPHWLLGNLLLRTGAVENAFQELRFATSANEKYLPNVIDLAWGITGRDPARTSAMIQPQTDSARMALAIFFANHKERAQAIAEFRVTTKYADEAANTLLAEMLKAGMFTEAYEVWSRARGVTAAAPSLINGGFEDEIDVSRPGFGWQTGQVANVTMSVDAAKPQSGSRSLRLDFHGESPPATLVSQLVLIKANSKYRLSFQASSKDLVSAGPPIVVISDANPAKPQVLGQSVPLYDVPGWREYLVEFSTGPSVEAITVTITRQTCPNQPCPIVGTLWLDSVELRPRSVIGPINVSVNKQSFQLVTRSSGGPGAAKVLDYCKSRGPGFVARTIRPGDAAAL